MLVALLAALACCLLAGPTTAESLPLSADELAFLSTVPGLPTTVDEMATYTRSEQKLILRSMGSTAQTAFWTGKLQAYLDSHPQLTDAQVKLIEYAKSVATAEFFALGQDELLRPIAERTIEGLSAAALEVFDRDEFAAIFITPSNEPAQCSPAGSGSGRVPTKAACNCRWGWGCGAWTSGGCDVTVNGCGIFGWERCNRVCHL